MSILARLEREIAAFTQNMQALASDYHVEEVCDYAYVLTPIRRGQKAPTLGPKHVGLCLLGLVHGTETAGAAVLRELTSLMRTGLLQPRVPLGLALGNPWAAREGRRFLDKDLNRCFASSMGSSREEKRAKELERLLGESAFLLDLHQTNAPSERPFFIFPFTEPSYAFARAIDPDLSIVTHWGKPFSEEGRCSDEFVNGVGGVGLTLELGQNGFDPYHVGAGLTASLRALAAAEAQLLGGQLPQSAIDAELYTWAHIETYPAEGEVVLAPGWSNFARLEAGQQVGRVNGEPLIAPVSGRMLFPKYMPPTATARPVAELYRIMRPATLAEARAAVRR